MPVRLEKFCKLICIRNKGHKQKFDIAKVVGLFHNSFVQPREKTDCKQSVKKGNIMFDSQDVQQYSVKLSFFHSCMIIVVKFLYVSPCINL